MKDILIVRRGQLWQPNIHCIDLSCVSLADMEGMARLKIALNERLIDFK